MRFPILIMRSLGLVYGLLLTGAYPKFEPLAILGYLFLIATTVTSFQRPTAN
ncbi:MULTISPECIES: hypothetical protein [Fischerella]|uniref:hypothetical protein n=1 Tax=Fischerella TaxID=1190 RepID=UPI001E63EB58|nr:MULTISPECIES: hypothetical protein [Fischerella]